MSDLLWGVDLGGTKIEAIVAPKSDPTNPLHVERVATEAEGGYEHILSRVGALLERLSAKVGARPVRVGFGTPGTVDPLRETLKNSNTICLNGRPLVRDLERLLSAEVRIANDANCFALAEARWGAGRGAEVVFGVIMGTGVGGGVVLRQSPWAGAQGNAGEWGHNVLIPDGELCYCGKRGCVEKILSGPALEAWYFSQAGQKRSLTEIVSLASSSKDAVAAATLDRLYREFGRAIAVVINILDPNVVVLGGGLSNIPGLCEEGSRYARHYVFNDRFETRIVPHQLGDSAGVFGAAALTEEV